MPQSPNILLIFTDQQTPRALSCAGNPHLQTPNMDALAARGIRFENCYCAAPVCGPSRSALATGLMPHQTGLIAHGETPDPNIATFGVWLREAGYDTAWTGKWHVTEPYPQSDSIPSFEYLPFDADIPIDLGEDTDDPIANNAIEYLRRPHDDKPFFLAVSLHNPHDICHEIVKLGRDNLPPIDTLPPLPANFAIDPDEPEFLANCRRKTHYGGEHQYTVGWSEHQWRAYLEIYYRLTEQVDGVVGRVLDELRAQGLEDETLIVFTSDHGEGVGAHHWVTKLMFWQEVAGVPLIVQLPGQARAGEVDGEHLVSLVDLAPTFCDYAGAAPPAVTGTSLRPVLENPNEPGRESVVVELWSDNKDLSKRGRMLRTKRWKYIAFSDGERREMLFDLANDPLEMHDLARDSEQRAVLERHRELLRAWCARTGDEAFVSLVPEG